MPYSQSKHQRETIDELIAAGRMIRVIDNLDDALAWLENFRSSDYS